MNTSRDSHRTPGIRLSLGPGLALILTVLGWANRLEATDVYVKPLQFLTVDTRVDDSVATAMSGRTYVLGSDGAGNAILRKYDSSGAELTFDNGTHQVVIAGITPTALAVEPGTTNLYIVGGNLIDRVSASSGQIISSGNAGTANVTFQSVCFFNHTLFRCGGFSGTGSAAVFGKTVQPRGFQAGIIVTLAKSNLGSALAAVTYGDSASGSVNTANSIAVDDNGDIYVGGKLGTGTFTSDVFNSGNFKVTYAHRGSGSYSLETAKAVLGGDYTSTTNLARADACNIFSLNDLGDYNYIWRETGIINVNSSGPVTFTSLTDDGSWLFVDGSYADASPVVWDDTTHGQQAHTGTIALKAGTHSIDWLFFNGGGPGNGSLLAEVGGASGCVSAADFTLHQNKGYVLKFGGDLSFLKNVYFSTSQSAGVGGEIKELTYAQGWIYGVGNWQGPANNPAINPVDNSIAGAQNIEILKLDTGLQLNARATVKGVADNTGYSITADDAGNAYLTGSYGPSAVSFFGNGDPTNHPFLSLSASKQSGFIAQLDSNFTFQWVNKPSSTPSALAQPVFSFSSPPRVRWNTVLQRLFWSGYFSSGVLFLGNATIQQQLNGPEGFLAVLDPAGGFTETANLTVVSAYGDSGSQIKPFGGPAPGTNNLVSQTNTQPLLKGARVTVLAPQYLYRNLANVDDTSEVSQNGDQAAGTQLTCTGYSVNGSVANGIANSYAFTLDQDTVVNFNWIVKYALNLASDVSETKGQPGTPILGLNSLDSGSPNPSVEKHWIAANDPVIAQINSYVDDPNYVAQGLPVRYFMDGYHASGAINVALTQFTNSANTSYYATNFVPVIGDDQVVQVPQFLMTGPTFIGYHWKLKVGVQVFTTSVGTAGLPYIQVDSDPGQVSPPVNNHDAAGVGTFYYDQGTSLEIGSLAKQGNTRLQGWYDGDGTVFTSLGDSTNLPGQFTRTNGSVYVSQPVTLTVPARVQWDYGAIVYDETVFIGNPVTFATVDPAVKASLHTRVAPAMAEVITGPVGSTTSDMALWDSVGSKYFPLKPGQMLTFWNTTSGNAADQVIVRLTINYPVVSHYHHIANTPPVQLTPNPAGLVSFNALKYTDSTTGAAVDQNGNFTATGPGKTVLLFNETSKSGRGGVVVTPRIRVVETHNWNDNLPTTQKAIIGQTITNAADTAGLGTGFVYFSNACYNASLHTPGSLTGPIIPVNLNFNAGPNNQLLVVWYQNNDTILWPYQAVRYEPAWPTTAAEGLGRIVIASRYGNESVDTNGEDQVVVDTETVGTNTYPAETVYDPSRYQNLKIYNQPDPTLPGYNPNEEHALLAPSLRSAALSPQPMAVYVLREGDLNITNRDSTYTSDPYVLVQFLDTVDNQYKMKLYNIVRADTNLSLGDLSYEYSFTQQMKAGEPVIPFYPLPQVIGATPGLGDYGKEGHPDAQICYWKDHKGTEWAVSGDGDFYAYYYYPLLPDFWWPAKDNELPGSFVAFLPDKAGYTNVFFDINKDTGQPFDGRLKNQTPPAQGIHYTTTWPADAPTLKVGETLTYPGGEFQSDHPTTYVLDAAGDLVAEDTPGLPGVVGFAAGQIVFDTMNPTMDDQLNLTKYTARIFPALEERTIHLSVRDLPPALTPANGRTTVQNAVYLFNGLPASLQKRIFYDPIRGVLGVKVFSTIRASAMPR